MRVWVYGANSEQIRRMIETEIHPGDIVVNTSVCAGSGSAFPQSGLTQALSAAIRGKIDVLLIPSAELLGGKRNAEEMTALFRSYGIPIKSLSSQESSSS